MKALLPLTAGVLLATLPAASPSAEPLSAAPTTSEIATHELALQGTAVALASETFQNLFIGVLAQSLTGPFDCNADSGGTGSSKVQSVTQVSATVKQVKFTYYFDNACARPFAVQTLNFVQHANGYQTGSGKIIYHSEAGAILGDLSLSLRFLQNSTNAIFLGATGSYVPRSGTPPLRLAVVCRQVQHIFAGNAMPCEVAAAQDFPALGKALGFHADVNQRLAVTIKFNAASSDLVTAPAGTLGVGFAPGWGAALTGTTTAFGTTTIRGQVGAFAVFPPTPTTWTITDTAHQQQFKTRVVNNTDRNSIGTITDTATTGRLATLLVDRSGTGTIRYAGKAAAAVNNWVLSK